MNIKTHIHTNIYKTKYRVTRSGPMTEKEQTAIVTTK